MEEQNTVSKQEFLRWVGLKIARLRRAKKITQADFADDIGVMINLFPESKVLRSMPGYLH